MALPTFIDSSNRGNGGEDMIYLVKHKMEQVVFYKK